MLICLIMNQYTTDKQWIYKMVTMYLLIMILWNKKKITENYRYGDNGDTWLYYTDKYSDDVLLPPWHIFRFLSKQSDKWSDTHYLKLLQNITFDEGDNYNFFGKKRYYHRLIYNDIKDAIDRRLVAVFRWEDHNGVNHTLNTNPNLQITEYHNILNRFNKKYAYKSPGETCIQTASSHHHTHLHPPGAYPNTNNKNSNDITCREGSSCLYINDKYGYRCTVGKDGHNPVNPNTNNGNKHYLYPNIMACSKNDSNLECPPTHECLTSQNICRRKEARTIPKIILKKESINRLTLNPPIPQDKIASCPEKYSVFEDDYMQYCKHDDNPDDICRLDPHGNKNYPICSSAICPNNYIFNDNLCVNKNDINDKCTLDIHNTEGHLLCGDYNEYIQLENKDIYNSNIKRIPNVIANECASECNKNMLCSAFVMDQNTETPICYLKKAPTTHPSIIDKKNRIIHFKNPINYDQYDNTDAPNNTIKTYKIKTPAEAARLCDQNDKCTGFIIDKNTLQCDLKSSFVNNNILDKSKMAFKKKYGKGNLCTSLKPSKIKQEIKNTIHQIDKNYYKNVDSIKVNHYNDLEKNKKDIINTASSKMINMFANDKETIIWDNINVSGTKLIFENINKNKMYISHIQILGKHNQTNNQTNKQLNLIQHNKTKLISDDNNIQNIVNKSQQIYSKSTYFNVILDDDYHINRIIIYNYLKKNNYPLKIGIYNKKGFLEKQWIKDNIKKIPKITNYAKFDYVSPVYDKGNPELFSSYANILGKNDSPSYCRFVKDDTQFCCKHKDSKNEYDLCVDTEKIHTNYSNSYLFNHNKETNKDDLCWCEGIPPKTNLKCIRTKNDTFEGHYKLASNVDCSNITGNQIKDQINNGSNIDDMSVHSGFYWDKTNKYYLFRNSTLNNKKIVLFTIIDADNYKIIYGYPKVVNNNTFPGLTIRKEISSILYAGNNDIYVIYGQIYVKYNLLNKTQYDNYPKKMINNWKYLDQNFQNNITNSIYIDSETCMLFNGSKLVTYKLGLIEHTNDIVTPLSMVVYNINHLFSQVKSLNYNCILYNYTDNIYLFFINNMYTIYDNTSKKKSTISFKKQWKNIWKFSK